MKLATKNDRAWVRLGRQYPRTRDYLAVGVQVCNVIALQFVVLGWGVRASVQVRTVKP